ncbi:MAG: alpha-L-fucosidase [Bacteroidales bacterium]
MNRLSNFYKLRILILFLIFIFPIVTISGTEHKEKPNKEWLQQRFSMFIHWGLYSQLGGVWDGKPVEWGYSEQIQSFAGIFSDYYAATAEKFTAEKWNADSIVALAKAAQMKSIVITAKHHDGFSMYATKFSDYNVVDATPFGRDPLMELSKACAKAGLRFGVYFSLIDWHFPQAYPISSSNADPITPEHHKHNINQVRELLTNYGPISEIWFDMGSLTREQSRELYTLVTTLQPQCMVSGRLGNDFGDFAVMADNACPNYPIEIPWQTAGSVFKETWSYRSWQKRDNLKDKIAEKIATLKNVIGHGGNYLLNIGPRGDGSVVEFERDLLLAMGKWLTDSSNVIYRVPKVNSNILPTIGELNYSNATPFYGYSCFDYYSSFRSIIGYKWHTNHKWNKKQPYIIYHAGDIGKELLFTVNGQKHPVKLTANNPILHPNNNSNIKTNYTFILHNGRSNFGEQFIDSTAFKAISSGIYTKTDLRTAEEYGWKNIENTSFTYTRPIKWKSNIWIAHIIDAAEAANIIAKFYGNSSLDKTNANETGAADAIEIWLNGKQLLKQGFTNTTPTPVYATLPLIKGQNTLIVKLHNRFENKINYTFTTDIPQTYYQQQLPFKIDKNNTAITLTLPGTHGGADIGLRDIRLIPHN